MREEELKLILNSFSSVRVYLAYPRELQAFIQKNASASPDVPTFLEKIEQMISAETDVTRRTDGQIYLNELKRFLR